MDDNVSRNHPFKLTQLKIEHYYLSFDNIEAGAPISTSVELTCEYSYEADRLNWNKTISHKYRSFDNYEQECIDSYTENFEMSENILSKIEFNDLRNLKNNYFSEEEPDNLTHWEITYNNSFKIVGTYDQLIPEVELIGDLLGLKMIMNQELKKVHEKINE